METSNPFWRQLCHSMKVSCYPKNMFLMVDEFLSRLLFQPYIMGQCAARCLKSNINLFQANLSGSSLVVSMLVTLQPCRIFPCRNHHTDHSFTDAYACLIFKLNSSQLNVANTLDNSLQKRVIFVVEIRKQN